MRVTVNNCVGCPNCSPYCRKPREVDYFCDDCGERLDDRFSDGERDLCLDCLTERHRVTCDKCGDIIDGSVFDWDGFPVCESCFIKIYEVK